MRRSALISRRSRLAPGKPLRRRTPLRRSNPERLARRRACEFGGQSYRAWLLSHPCCTCGEPRVELSHVRSRGAGGKAADMVPQCRACHRELHASGRAAFPDFDLLAVARAFASRGRELGLEV